MERVISNVNAMMEQLSLAAKADADLFWTRMVDTAPSQWRVRDVEKVSKGFFSSARDPTRRTLTVALDVTEPYVRVRQAHEATFKGRVEAYTLAANYGQVVRDHLFTKMDPTQKDAYTFTFNYTAASEYDNKKTPEHCRLEVSYSYNLI